MAVEKPPSAFESPPIATALATFALDDVPNANALLPFARLLAPMANAPFPPVAFALYPMATESKKLFATLA